MAAARFSGGARYSRGRPRKGGGICSGGGVERGARRRATEPSGAAQRAHT